MGGFVYLITIVCGLFAEVYARGGVYVAGDPAASLARLRASEALFRLGIGADLVMLGCYIVVTIVLYRLFRRRDALLSSIASGFSFVGIAVLASGIIYLLAALLLAGQNGGGAAISATGVAESIDLALRLHGRAYGLCLVFFGVYCCLIGAMIVRSRLVPALVGWLMVLAGIAFLVNNCAAIVAPEFGQRIPPLTMLTSLVGEGALGVWLAIFGVRSQAKSDHAAEHQALAISETPR